jgi:AmmeMemoRadiSam system protein B
LYPAGAWQTPLGLVEVDGELAGKLAGCRDVKVDADAHRLEHSIEVQLPLLQVALPGVKIAPLMVLPGMWAEGIGRECARVAIEAAGAVGFLGSTDLTHYGPAFGFEPAGRGEEGVAWAGDVNDRRLVELIRRMDAAGVIREAEAHRNACGAGAVAAMIGAMRELGATQYVELEHRTSADCKVIGAGDRDNSVGYEAGVFQRPGEAI